MLLKLLIVFHNDNCISVFNRFCEKTLKGTRKKILNVKEVIKGLIIMCINLDKLNFDPPQRRGEMAHI